MEAYKRDFLISRIITGRTIFKKGNLVLHIDEVGTEEEFDLNQHYVDVYEEAKDFGLYTSEEILKIMSDDGLWTEDEEELLNKLSKNIENHKVAMFNSKFSSINREIIRKRLRADEERLSSLGSKKNIYQHITCEGYASFSKFLHFMEISARHPDKTLYKEETGSASYIEILASYQDQMLEDGIIRELSKVDSWKQVWAVSREANRWFDKESTNLTREQTSIVLWSKTYDSAHESPDCPSEQVLEDDDLFDGWMIQQRREREKSTNSQMAEDTITNSKISNSQDIFIPVQGVEDIEAIESLNDPAAHIARNSRMNQLQNSESGRVQHGQLTDVKLDKLSQMNESLRHKSKG
jgi:hypothetical protein